MKKLITATLAAGLILAPAAASAAVPAASVKTFSNCTALNAKYKGGVAKDGKAVNTKRSGGKAVRAKSQYRPKVIASVYKANARLDRDKDGIVCER